MSEIIIKEVKYWDLNFLNLSKFPRSVNYYTSAAQESSNTILTAWSDDKVVGIAVTMQIYNDAMGLIFIYVPKSFREQGIGRKLIKASSSFAESRNCKLRVGLQMDKKELIPLCYLLVSENFVLSETATVYISNVHKRAMKNKYREIVFGKMVPVMESFLVQGYELSSFAEAPPMILKNLEKSCERGDYPVNFNPFDIVGRKIDYEFSFIMWKNDLPIAFTASLRYGNILINELGAVHKDYQRRGIIVVPCTALYRKIAQSKIRVMKAFVYTANLSPQKLFKNKELMGGLFDEKKLQFNYCKNPSLNVSTLLERPQFINLPENIRNARTVKEALTLSLETGSDLPIDEFEEFIAWLTAQNKLQSETYKAEIKDDESDILAGW